MIPRSRFTLSFVVCMFVGLCADPSCALGQVPPATILAEFNGKSLGADPVRSLLPTNGGFIGATSGQQGTNSTLFKVSYSGSLTTLQRFKNPRNPPFPESWPWVDDLFRRGGLIHLQSGGNQMLRVGDYGFTSIEIPELGDFFLDDVFLGRDGYFYSYFSFPGSGYIVRAGLDGGARLLAGFFKEGELGPNNLIQATDGNLYGTTTRGGRYGRGTLFRVNPSGGLTKLADFRDGSPSRGLLHAKDGFLYGTIGGTRLFRMSTGGGQMQVFNPSGKVFGGAEFQARLGEAMPRVYSIGGIVTDLIQGRDGNFYGRTSNGGGGILDKNAPFSGTVFKITPAGRVEVVAGLMRKGKDYESYKLVQGKDGSLYGAIPNTAENPHGVIFKVDAALLKDAALPVVRITYPPGRKFFTNKSRLVVRGTATDDLDPVRLQTVHEWDGFALPVLRERALRVSSGDPKLKAWAAAVSTESWREGEHSFLARVFDKVGKVSKPAEVIIVLDKTAPNSHPKRPVGEVGGSLAVLSSDYERRQVLAKANQRRVVVRGLAADNNGVVRVDYRLKRPTSASYGSWKSGKVETRKSVDLFFGRFDRNWTVNADLDSKGQWRMQVRVSDVAGNSTTWTFTINRT